MLNRRKGMVLYGIWLTRVELEMIVQGLRNQAAVALIGTIIKKAYKRGDFKKN